MTKKTTFKEPKKVWAPGPLSPKEIENDNLSKSDLMFLAPAIAGLVLAFVIFAIKPNIAATSSAKLALAFLLIVGCYVVVYTVKYFYGRLRND